MSSSERARRLPSTGTSRSRAFSSSSARVNGFSKLPLAASVLCFSTRPSFSFTSITQRQRRCTSVSFGSPTALTRLRIASTFGSFIRSKLCADAKVTPPSTSITDSRCCTEMSGISRLFTISSSLSGMKATSSATSSARMPCFAIRSPSTCSGPWIGPPTGQRLMLARITS